jgi:hypothetical protein
MKQLAFIIITLFLTSCSPNQENESDLRKSDITEVKRERNVYGKWQVVNSTHLPFEHISYCENLNLNSIFEFKKDQTLEVYEAENSETCTKDQTFKVIGTKLQIIEWDMVFDYEIQILNNDTLKFKIDRIPNNFWSQPNLNDSIVSEKIKEFK